MDRVSPPHRFCLPVPSQANKIETLDGHNNFVRQGIGHVFDNNYSPAPPSRQSRTPGGDRGTRQSVLGLMGPTSWAMGSTHKNGYVGDGHQSLRAEISADPDEAFSEFHESPIQSINFRSLQPAKAPTGSQYAT